jgi:hypothetical protein
LSRAQTHDIVIVGRLGYMHRFGVDIKPRSCSIISVIIPLFASRNIDVSDAASKYLANLCHHVSLCSGRSDCTGRIVTYVHLER